MIVFRTMCRESMVLCATDQVCTTRKNYSVVQFQEMIPVKWMSPEQLNLNSGERRKYDANTDVWSFGVTLWEIFNKGERPRSRHKMEELEDTK